MTFKELKKVVNDSDIATICIAQRKEDYNEDYDYKAGEDGYDNLEVFCVEPIFLENKWSDEGVITLKTKLKVYLWDALEMI